VVGTGLEEHCYTMVEVGSEERGCTGAG